MKIVFLDSYTLNPGDMSFEALAHLGEFKAYPRTSSHEVIAHIGDAEIVLTNKVLIDEAVLNACPKIKYIGVMATGFNVVNIKRASEKGIVVTNIPAYSTMSVAQHVFALLLNYCNDISALSLSVTEGQWQQAADFCYQINPQVALENKTFGLIGFGAIANAVANIAKAFGMQVIVYTPRPPRTQKQVQFFPLETVLKKADILSLHCPLNEKTKALINEKNIALMKKDSILINTARGALIDEKALALALKEKRIQCALLDVLVDEPPKKDNPFVGLKNCIITPHVAWANVTARKRLIAIAEKNIQQFFANTPINQVNAVG